MTVLIILAFILCIPLCRAITLARRAGYPGFLGFVVWFLERHARESYALSGGVRQFVEGRHAARRQWDEEVGR